MVVAMVMRIAFLVDFILPGAARTDVTIDSLEMVPATEVMPRTAPPEVTAQYQDRTAMRITCNNLGESGTVVSGYAYLRAGASGRIIQKMQLGGDRGLMLLPLSKVRTNVIFPQKLSSGGYAVEVRAHYGERKRRLEAGQLFQVTETGEATAVGEFGSQAERYSLRLSPESMKFSLKTGITTTRQFHVKNEEQVPLDCTAQVVGFGVELDGTVIEEALGTTSQITVSPEQFTIPASAAIRLRVQATLGEGLEPTREHYWMVKVTGRPQEAKPGEVGAALAASLLVGADPRQVQPAAPELAGTEVQQGLDNTVFQLVVHNAGGSALPLKGKLTVKESGGEEIASLPVPQSEEITILAGSSRLLKVMVLQAMADKPWECELALRLGSGQGVKFPFQVKPVPKSLPPSEQEESGST
jgi:P pilus assembly chaperone PapD